MDQPESIWDRVIMSKNGYQVNQAYCPDGDITNLEMTPTTDDTDEHVCGAADPTVTPAIECSSPILYKINDSPPVFLTIFFALQQTLLSIVGSLIAPFFVAETSCAIEDGITVRKLVSTAMMMNGITTLFQSIIGVRLPVFQGPSGSYLVPLLALNRVDKNRCNLDHFYNTTYGTDASVNISQEALQQELIGVRLREMMGPLILVGLIHGLIGATGFVGVLMRFIGPVTIVPTILLIGLYTVVPAINYSEAHWGLAFMTWAIGVLLSLYLGHRAMPIPVWTRTKGFHVIRYPLHQVFSVLITITIGWTVCGILTYADVFTNDKSSKEFKARTDARADTIENSGWFYVPHPGQFGAPMFSVSLLVGFFIATITSILDSIGDYYACANMCHVPPPPRAAVNRGIAIEGICTALSGVFGAGHATTTYGANIGGIGLTKVASRRVFVAMSLMYIVLGMLAKVMAYGTPFAQIPHNLSYR